MIATPVFTHVELCTRSLLAGKHTFVEKPLATSASHADELCGWRGRASACSCAVTRSSTRPAGQRRQAHARRAACSGDVYFISSSRVNLGLHQRDIERHLGPRPARLLDPAALAGRAAGRRARDRAATRSSHGVVGRRLRDAAVPVGHRGPGRAELARAEQAAAHRRRRQREDGRLRGRRRGAGPAVRPRRRLPRPGDVRRVPAVLPDGRHRLAEARYVRAAGGRAPGLRPSRPCAGRHARTTAALARDVVAITEAASRSLEAGGAEVRVERSAPLYALPGGIASGGAPVDVSLAAGAGA